MQTQSFHRALLSTYFVPGSFQTLRFSSEYKSPLAELGVGDSAERLEMRQMCVGVDMMKRTGQGDSGCIRAEAWERRQIQEGILRRVLPIEGQTV